jgi:hypothetical protein
MKVTVLKEVKEKPEVKSRVETCSTYCLYQPIKISRHQAYSAVIVQQIHINWRYSRFQRHVLHNVTMWSRTVGRERKTAR